MLLTRLDLPGDGPWSRRLRAESRAAAVRRVAEAAAKTLLPDAGEEEIKVGAAWLAWAESSPIHFRRPGCEPPTRRPRWWTDGGLPDRRQRRSGGAWNAAAATVAAQMGIPSWTPKGERYYDPAFWRPSPHDGVAVALHAALLARGDADTAAELAARICGRIAEEYAEAARYRAAEATLQSAAQLLAAWEDRWAAALAALPKEEAPHLPL